MSTWIYAAMPEHGFDPNDQPPKQIVKDAALAPRFSGMTAENIADTLNKEKIFIRSKVTTWQAKSLLMKTGEWGAIVLLSRRTPPDSDIQQQKIVAAAITAIAAMEQTSQLDMDEPITYGTVSAMLDAFVSVGALSTDTRDKLVGLSNIEISVWQPPLTAEIVSAAMEL